LKDAVKSLVEIFVEGQTDPVTFDWKDFLGSIIGFSFRKHRLIISVVNILTRQMNDMTLLT
jgi:hypothetical protein